MKLTSYIITICVCVFILSSCNDENSTMSKSLDDPTVYYTINPYEWFGEQHNEILTAIIDSIDPYDYYSLSWPIEDLIDTVLSFSMNYMINEINSQISPLNTIETEEADKWIDMLGNTEEMLDTLNAYLTEYPCSTLDKQYTACVIGLVEEIQVTPDQFDCASFSNKVDSLESVILAQDWASTDMFALMSISLLKHTTSYHCSLQSSTYKNHKYEHDMTLATKAQKVATISTDFIVGTGWVVGVGLGTSGAGVPLAVAKAPLVGATASGIVDMVGGWFDWWD